MIDLQTYTADRKREVAKLLTASDFGFPVDPETGYWGRLLERPDACSEVILCAHSPAGEFALASVPRRPMLDGRGRSLFLLLPRSGGALELAEALLDAARRELADRGITRKLVTAQAGNDGFRRLLESRGFTPLLRLHTMTWSAAEAEPAPRSVPGVSLTLYQGGEPALDREVAALWARVFAGDRMLAPMTPAEVDRALREEGGWMMLARDEGSGRLIGASEAGVGAFFIGIAVARSHWGKGVAELLAAASMQEFMRRGLTSLFSQVEVNNAASLSLHRRMGWQRAGESTVYLSQPLPV